jgi:hypothetical protein
MSKKVENNAELLHALAKAKLKMCKCIIEGADKDLVDALCECALNVLYGNVPLTKEHKTRLAKHKNSLRELVSHPRQNQEKKKTILQKGGFLAALLAPLVTSVIGPILGKVLGQ